MATLTVTSCDCGFTSKPASEAMAAYSLRKHSCEKWRRAAASRAHRLELEAAIDRTPKPCRHKQARHEHGTHACYVLDRCRCWPCAKANTAYESMRSRQKAYGRWEPYIHAGPAVAHVRTLMAAGIGLKQITKLTGVSGGMLWKLVYGKRGPDGVPRPSTQIRRETAERLFKVQPGVDSLAGGAFIDSTGTLRRLQALIAMGWSQSKLGERIGVTGSNFGQLLRRGRVTKQTAQRVAKLYDELWDTPPPSATHRDRITVSRARNYARAHGFAPPLAWDDDTIDDPAARPAIDAELEDQVLDEVAVRRIMAGQLQVPSIGAGQRNGTPPELLEAIRRLAADGWSDRRIAERVGRKPNAVTAIRLRHAIPAGVPASRPPAAASGPTQPIDGIAASSVESEAVAPGPPESSYVA